MENIAGIELFKTSLLADPNLQFYSRFENNANDASTHGYNLGQTNTPTYTTGQFGQAIVYSTGSSQYASILDGSASGLKITGQMSVVGWFKATSHTQSNFIASKINNANQGYLLVQTTLGPMQFTLSGLTTNTTSIGATTLVDGTWYHVAGVYNGATIKVYINAVEDGSAAASGSHDDNATSFASGCSFQGGGDTASNFGSFTLDDMAVFNRALTISEIRLLYFGISGALFYNQY